MIREVVLKGYLLPNEQRERLNALAQLRNELRCDAIRPHSRTVLPRLNIALDDWRHPSVSIHAFDRLLNSVASQGDFSLCLSSRAWRGGAAWALQLLTRYQRLLPPPSEQPNVPRFDEVHCAVAKIASNPHTKDDYDRAVDTWRWLVRLCENPSPPLQLAAFFQRVSENRARARAVLSGLDLDRRLVVAALRLLGRFGHAHDDPELQLLADAESLSFFSLDTWTHLRDFGEKATFNHARAALARMTDAAARLVLTTRQPPAITSALRELHPREQPSVSSA